jgi:chromosome segregation ATPase
VTRTPWKQAEENLGQPLENLQQSISELSKTIAAVEQEPLPIEVQYSEVLTAAKAWQTQLMQAQTQGLEDSIQMAKEKFQELRQQAICLKMQIKEKEQEIAPLRETLNKASMLLQSMK